jgi:hypothetical protein
LRIAISKAPENINPAGNRKLLFEQISEKTSDFSCFAAGGGDFIAARSLGPIAEKEYSEITDPIWAIVRSMTYSPNIFSPNFLTINGEMSRGKMAADAWDIQTRTPSEISARMPRRLLFNFRYPGKFNVPSGHQRPLE